MRVVGTTVRARYARVVTTTVPRSLSSYGRLGTVSFRAGYARLVDVAVSREAIQLH